MRPTIFKTVLPALFILLLCACQADDGQAVAPEQKRPADVRQSIQAYSPTITGCDIEDAEFSLIYLDDDAVPELVILDRSRDRYSIYTIKDGSAVCLVDCITTVEMTYYERRGVISAFYRWNGGGDEGSYASAYYQMDRHPEALTDDSIPDFEFAYNAVYDEDGQWTGTGTTGYFARGEEIDEGSYRQILDGLSLSEADEKSCFSEDNACFTKDGILTDLGIEAPAKAAKSPEQLLAEQPIDGAHDAFLIDTGGKLGTLLVTAELAAERKGGSGARDVTFSVWNPAEMGQPIQVFSEEFLMGVAPEFHHVVDANFDGFQDFGYLFLLGNQPNYCHYWLWDEEAGAFQYCAPLAEISQAVFDPERQVITGWARSSGAGDGVTTFHRWEDGEPVCVRRVESFSPWEAPSTVSVWDRIDGELRQVYDEEFPWSGEELEGREAWRQAQYQWCDLDYHGEPS